MPFLSYPTNSGEAPIEPVDSQRKTALRAPVAKFFLLTFVLSMVGQGLNYWVVAEISDQMGAGVPVTGSPLSQWRPYAFYLTNIGPSLAGILMTFYLYGVCGLREIVRKLNPRSIGSAWPVLALCLFAPLVFEVLVLTVLQDPPRWSLFAYLYGAIVGGGLTGAGICEEIGWRGFALPHLQRRYSALTSSVIIGITWGLWHWPNYLINSHPHPFPALLMCLPAGILAACLYTWAFNATGGSLFTVIVFHGTAVTSVGGSSSENPLYSIAAAVMSVLIVALLVWHYGPENMSPKDKVVQTRT